MAPPFASDVLRIRKYPNRRFYDATHSRHVTLDDLFRFVRDGHQIEVHDPDGRDITNVVLMQIILEHDRPKMDLFPSALLHQTIQANQQMVRRFVYQYFSRAMDAFVASRKQFDDFLAEAGLSPLKPLTPFDWARMFLRGFDEESGPGSGSEVQEERRDAAGPEEGLAELRAEMAVLSEELARLKTRRPSARKKAVRKTRKAKRKPAKRRPRS